MSYKILTKNAVENTNIDGARDHFFNSGNQDGLVKGALNEGTLTVSSNSIILDTCELRISGHRVVVTSSETTTISSVPATTQEMSLIAQIIVSSDSTPVFSVFAQQSSIALIKNNLFKTISGAGTYQIELAKFTQSSTGVLSNLVKTVPVISIGGGGSSVEVVQEKGTSTTAVMSQNAVTTEINDLWAAINYVAPTISIFGLSPTSTSYKLPASFILSAVNHQETNIGNIKGTLTLKRGSTVIKSGILPISTYGGVSASDSVTLTTSGVTYRLSGVDKKGRPISRSVTISAYYTSYFGASENSTVSNTLIAGLTDTNSASLTGTRSVTVSGTNKYIWFISTKPISSIKSSGFDVPYTLVNSSYSYNGGIYNCYRTTEKIVAGDNTFVIV